MTMFQFIYILFLLYVSIVAGSYLKFTMCGYNKKPSIVLSFFVPILLILLYAKAFIGELRKSNSGVNFFILIVNGLKGMVYRIGMTPSVVSIIGESFLNTCKQTSCSQSYNGGFNQSGKGVFGRLRGIDVRLGI